MSLIDAKAFNEMLRKDDVVLRANEPPVSRTIRLVYKGECLQGGIEYALTHLEEIVEWECKNTFDRQKEDVIAHLKAAKAFIGVYQEGDEKEKVESEGKGEKILPLGWIHRISDFLIKCHLLARTIPEEFTLLIDENRKEQIYKMFGAPFCEKNEDYNLLDEFLPKYLDGSSYCTQIIFDSADFQSAMDTLFARSCHSLHSPWNINAVYIQESLRKEVLRRMNDNGKLILKERTILSGKVLRNADTGVEFIFGVLPKYMEIEKKSNAICINFFRTATEVNALMKEYPCKLFSIWTEKIGLFYEMASKLGGSIIWSNSVGLIDENTVRTLYGLDNVRQSGHSMINTDERYAVHCLHNADGSSKYLVIPFGVSIAN